MSDFHSVAENASTSDEQTCSSKASSLKSSRLTNDVSPQSPGHSLTESRNGSAESRIGQEVVVLLHGLAGSKMLMRPLMKQVADSGYQTLNWGYRSMRRGIETHATRFGKLFSRLEADPTISRFHIVPHSMGSIVTRVALQAGVPQKLGRIVMLCPPNRGSHVATKFSRRLGWFCRPLKQLADREDSFVNSLPMQIPGDPEVGVIVAGGDLVVRESSTMLPGIRDQTTIPGMHSGILIDHRTAEQVIHFIREGVFRSGE